MIHTIFFDLDNTLYSRDSGIWEAIGARINLFMTDVLKISENEVKPLRIKYREEFGTTLMGLQSMFDVDDMEYLEFVHDVDLHAMLTDDGELAKMLRTISQRKVIFTNSDKAHTLRVLRFFGVQDFFEEIIDLIAMKPHVKPQPEAYDIALRLAGLNSPDGCMFVDDMLENIEGASRAGFRTVYVSDEHTNHCSIPNIFALPDILKKINQDD